MPEKEKELEKVTIRLFRGDKELLEQLYPKGQGIGYNKALRYILRGFLRRIEEQVGQTVTTSQPPALDIEE